MYTMYNIYVFCLTTYRQVFGQGAYLILFACALMFILLNNDKKVKQLFLGHTALFSFVYWCPVTAYIIYGYCIGMNVYWRMFWLLPMTIAIAYAMTKSFDFAKTKMAKVLLLVLIIALTTDCGASIYNAFNFIKADNPYKISQVTMDMCDAIKEHAKANDVEERGVIVPDILVMEIKQYDGEIRMPYGRDMLNGMGKKGLPTEIHLQISTEAFEPNRLVELAREGNYQYLIFPSYMYQTTFTDVGYQLIGVADSYNIYYLSEG